MPAGLKVVCHAFQIKIIYFEIFLYIFCKFIFLFAVFIIRPKSIFFVNLFILKLFQFCCILYLFGLLTTAFFQKIHLILFFFSVFIFGLKSKCNKCFYFFFLFFLCFFLFYILYFNFLSIF